MRTIALFIAFIVVQARAAPPIDVSTRLGIVVRHHDALCFYLPETGAKPGDAVSIVTLDPPQGIAGAVLDGRGKDCPNVVTPHVAAFALRLTSGTLPEGEASVGIAGGGRLSSAQGGVSWDGGISFQSCTSADGVHLTAWRGGVRQWHAYYYVGQDLTPDCSAEASRP